MSRRSRKTALAPEFRAIVNPKVLPSTTPPSLKGEPTFDEILYGTAWQAERTAEPISFVEDEEPEILEPEPPRALATKRTFGVGRTD